LSGRSVATNGRQLGEAAASCGALHVMRGLRQTAC